MNAKVWLGLMLIAPPLAAQNYQGMSQQDMQRMMQGAQQMQACMQQVDQRELEQFQRRAEAAEKEVREMCAAGRRDAAQQRAMAFGREAAANPTMQQMGKCGRMAAGMMPQMPFVQQAGQQADSANPQHICDQ